MLKTRFLLTLATTILAASSACTPEDISLGLAALQDKNDKNDANKVSGDCNDDPSLSAVAGIRQPDGTCSCHPGFSLNASTGRCQAAVDAGVDKGPLVTTCTFLADQTCNDDASYSGIAGTCTKNDTCDCFAGFSINPATGRCKVDPRKTCVVGANQTCNDDPSYDGVAGTCKDTRTCVCNPGFALNSVTGLCKAETPSVPAANPCVVGADQTCNDDASYSGIAGTCKAPGVCACNSGFGRNPATGLCQKETTGAPPANTAASGQ
jgi:hypothetical protein